MPRRDHGHQKGRGGTGRQRLVAVAGRYRAQRSEVHDFPRSDSVRSDMRPRAVARHQLLLRAHGEPPETYAIARRNNIQLIDATCPVVLHCKSASRRSMTQWRGWAADCNLWKERTCGSRGSRGPDAGTAIVIEDLEDADGSTSRDQSVCIARRRSRWRDFSNRRLHQSADAENGLSTVSDFSTQSAGKWRTASPHS